MDSWQETMSIPALAMRPMRRRSAIQYTEQMTPKHYWGIDTNGNEMEVTFHQDYFIAAISDGRTERQEFERVDFVLESNMISQLAYKLQSLPRGQSVELMVFIPEAIDVIPYAFSRSPQGYETNFGETIYVDDQGWIEEVHYPIEECSSRQAKKRVPSWKLTAETLKHSRKLADYVPPTDGTVEIIESVVEGPHRSIQCTIARPPKKSDCFAVALFLGGSGRYNRHGRVGPLDLGYHRILDGLARLGIATLRYERYGDFNAKSAIDEKDVDLDMLLEDAEACFRALQDSRQTSKLPKILIGHSMGALLAMILASRTDGVDGVVSLAGPGRRLKEILLEQNLWFQDELEVSNISREQMSTRQAKFISSLESDNDWDEKTEDSWILLYRRKRKLYKSLINEDPLDYVRQLSCWLLIVQGTKDVQVGVEDATRLYDAGIASKVPCSMVMLNGYNHLFQRAVNSNIEDLISYTDRRRKVSATFISTLAELIREQV